MGTILTSAQLAEVFKTGAKPTAQDFQNLFASVFLKAEGINVALPETFRVKYLRRQNIENLSYNPETGEICGTLTSSSNASLAFDISNIANKSELYMHYDLASLESFEFIAQPSSENSVHFSGNEVKKGVISLNYNSYISNNEIYVYFNYPVNGSTFKGKLFVNAIAQ